MSLQQPSNLTSSIPPWPQKQISYGSKLLLCFVAALLAVITLISGLIWVSVVPELLTTGAYLRDPMGAVGQVLKLSGVFVVSLFGAIMLFRRISASTSFTPSYGLVHAELIGHPFEVRYQRSGWGRSLIGRGSVHFTTDGLIIDGYLRPNLLLLTGGVVLCMEIMLILLYILGIRLSLPVISIIAKLPLPWIVAHYYARRKQISERVAYTNIYGIIVKGDMVMFASTGAEPRNVTFFVDASDGERLYRELQARFPESMIAG